MTLLNATIGEDEKWNCKMEEELFIGTPSITEQPTKLTLTINEKTSTEATNPTQKTNIEIRCKSVKHDFFIQNLFILDYFDYRR